MKFFEDTGKGYQETGLKQGDQAHLRDGRVSFTRGEQELALSADGTKRSLDASNYDTLSVVALMESLVFNLGLRIRAELDGATNVAMKFISIE